MNINELSIMTNTDVETLKKLIEIQLIAEKEYNLSDVRTVLITRILSMFKYNFEIEEYKNIGSNLKTYNDILDSYLINETLNEISLIDVNRMYYKEKKSLNLNIEMIDSNVSITEYEKEDDIVKLFDFKTYEPKYFKSGSISNTFTIYNVAFVEYNTKLKYKDIVLLKLIENIISRGLDVYPNLIEKVCKENDGKHCIKYYLEISEQKIINNDYEKSVYVNKEIEDVIDLCSLDSEKKVLSMFPYLKNYEIHKNILQIRGNRITVQESNTLEIRIIEFSHVENELEFSYKISEVATDYYLFFKYDKNINKLFMNSTIIEKESNDTFISKLTKRIFKKEQINPYDNLIEIISINL